MDKPPSFKSRRRVFRVSYFISIEMSMESEA